MTEATFVRLNKAQVWAELNISPRTLDNLVQRQEFPPGVRIGRFVYWSAKAVDNFRERAFAVQENWTPMRRTTR